MTDQFLTLWKELEDRKNSLYAHALPEHIKPETFLRNCYTFVTDNPDLLKCTRSSLLSSIATLAQIGLPPEGILGNAWIIPFYDKKNKLSNAQVMIGFRGYLALMRRSGLIKTIYSHAVYENDDFDFCLGVHKDLNHRPNTAFGNRGEICGAYTVAHYIKGSFDFDYMYKKEIDDARNGSKLKDGIPWTKYYSEMAKKTSLRRFAKYQTLSPEMNQAISLENEFEKGRISNLEDGIVVSEPVEKVENSSANLNQKFTPQDDEKVVDAEFSEGGGEK